jgi:GT2 family glycosyltransferase
MMANSHSADVSSFIAKLIRRATRRFRRRKVVAGDPQQTRPVSEIPHPDIREIFHDGISAGSSVSTRLELIDIVVCVHNAFTATQSCLTSLIETTTKPYHVIIVDDGSDEQTGSYLEEFARRDGVTLIRNDRSKGYTSSANAGLRASSAAWVVLLNSDTILTANWLDRMWGHGQRDDRIGIVGPISNCAAWQSVPRLNAAGHWRSSKVPNGMTVHEIASIASRLGGITIEIPFLNGFCFMIRRRVIDDIGHLDEEHFDRGYGEEHDFSIRAAKAGWRFAVASDAYVYHEGSQSFKAEEKRVLIERGEQTLRSKHDAGKYLDRQVAECRDSVALASLRSRFLAAIERQNLSSHASDRWAGRQVAFAISGEYPGAAFEATSQEALALERMAVSVTWLKTRDASDQCSPPLTSSTNAKSFDNWHDLCSHLAQAKYDAVIGTSFSSLGRLPCRSEASGAAIGYMVDSLPPWFFSRDEERFPSSFRAYAEMDEFEVFVRTAALGRQFEIFTGRTPVVCVPAIDLERFYVQGNSRARTIRARRKYLAAELRPHSPWPDCELTLNALNAVQQRVGQDIEIVLFGADNETLGVHSIAAPWATNIGKLNREKTAALLNSAQFFVDATASSGVSLSAMEAAACGCVVIAGNAIIVDSSTPEQYALAVETLLHETDRRNNIQLAAVTNVYQNSPERGAAMIMKTLLSCDPASLAET